MQRWDITVEGHADCLPEILAPDLFLSDRYLGGQAASEWALKWAVFADGIKHYWDLSTERTCRSSREFRDEEQWILDDDAGWSFSFTNLCESFGMNADSIRASLFAWKKAHVDKDSMTPPYERRWPGVMPRV